MNCTGTASGSADDPDAGMAEPDAGMRSFNYFEGCLTQVDTTAVGEGEDAGSFLQRCANVVNCSLSTRCGLVDAGPADAGGAELPCYCGEQERAACESEGPTSNAPCADAWQEAAGTETSAELFERLTDLSYPIGWAKGVLDCYVEKCAAECLAR